MTKFCRALSLASLLTFLGIPVYSQTPSGGPSAGKARTTKVSPWVSVTGEYDDNIFLLSSSRKNSLNNPSSTDAASGRFNAMENPADAIAQFEGGLSLETPGAGGRPFALQPSIEYNHYARNTERNYFTAALALQQALARGSRLRFTAAFTPDYFAKNYLADATDTNGDKSISPSERRYAAARYSETDADLKFRFRIRKGTKSSPLAARVDVGAGYYTRSYDAPFSSRNLRGPTVAAELGVDPARRAAFTLGYKLGVLTSELAPEVLILDEPAVGADLNGNGRATDLAVRTVQTVDRSRTEHEALIGVQLAMTPGTSLRGNVGFRSRMYSSDQKFDVAHRDRRDNRIEGGAELVKKLAQAVRFNLGIRYARQTTDRSFDPDLNGDAEDYTRLRANAGLRYEFR